jgi:hypothetical protein
VLIGCEVTQHGVTMTERHVQECEAGPSTCLARSSIGGGWTHRRMGIGERACWRAAIASTLWCTQNALARLLRPHEVSPVDVGPAHARRKGYKRAQFEHLFRGSPRPSSSAELQPRTRTGGDGS